MEVNEEKRQKFMEFAAKRVNNVMHDISILEPMARSNSYDFTKTDVDEMFDAIQNSLDAVREEYNRKFEAKAKTAKQSFSFGQSKATPLSEEVVSGNITEPTTEMASSMEEIPNVEETVVTSME